MDRDLEERTMIGGRGFRREDNDRWTGISDEKKSPETTHRSELTKLQCM